jgi:hypothetical protein
VSFSVDPATTNDACTLSSGTVRFDHAGSCVIAADRAGDADHAAGHATQTIGVGKSAQTVTFTSPAPGAAAIGDTYTPAATATGGGPVSFSVDPATTSGACTVAAGAVTFAHAGSCVIAADHAGDADHLPGRATQTIAVDQTAQAVTFTSPAPAPASIGSTYTPTVTGGGSLNPVRLSIDPATTNDACTLWAATVTFAHAGSCVIAADQDGDTDYRAGHATQTIGVAKTARAVAFTSTPPAPAHVHQTYDVTTTGGTSGNPVQLAASGACQVDIARVTFVRVGTCTVTATQDGDSDTQPSEASQTIDVIQSHPVIVATRASAVPRSAYGWYRAPVTITFRCDPDTSSIDGACPGPVTLTASGSDITVRRSFTTTDGATATATVRTYIDQIRPRARPTGVWRHVTYTSIPDVGCAAHDGLSGMARCRVLTRVTHHGTRLVYRLTATDRAGNRRLVKGRVSLDVAAAQGRL